MMLRLGQRINVVHRVNNSDSGTRYGFNLHEMRDIARSLWHENGSDLSVAEFTLRHSIDKNGYDRIMTLSPDYAIKEFKKAEPYLNLMSETTSSETQSEVSALKIQIALLNLKMEETVFFRNLENYLEDPEGLMIPAEISSFEAWTSQNLNYKFLLEKDAEIAKKYYSESEVRQHLEYPRINRKVLNAYYKVLSKRPEQEISKLKAKQFKQRYGFAPKMFFETLTVEEKDQIRRFSRPQRG